MATGEFVTMVVDGQALQGWQEIRVTHSAVSAATSFELIATNPSWSYNASQLRFSKILRVYTTPDGDFGRFAGGDLLSTGWCDVYTSSAGPGAARAVTVEGRSLAADPIDCSAVKHKTGYVENKTLAEAANAFNEWELKFQHDVPLEQIPRIQLIPQMPLFFTLEKEARRLGLSFMGLPSGDVNITKGTDGRHTGSLVEGRSPLKSYRVEDRRNINFSVAVVRGQKSEGVEEQDIRQEERAYNEEYGRYRPLLFFNEGSNTARELRERAEWELSRRNGTQIQITAQVASWRDQGGMLWRPRKLINVVIESEEISQDFAIYSVTFHQVVGEGDGCGTFADLVLVHPDGLGKNQ